MTARHSRYGRQRGAACGLPRGANVVGGTAWLWSREEYFEAVDVLFVDEAGQMSLANVLAVSQAAKNLVLLGDPQQLEQPVKGSHPDGADVSALEHLLAGQKTISPDRACSWTRRGACIRGSVSSLPRFSTRGDSIRARDSSSKRSKGTRGWANRASGSSPFLTKAIKTPRRKRSSVSCGLVDGLVRSDVNWIDDKGRGRPLRLGRHPHCRAVQCAGVRPVESYSERARRHGGQVSGTASAGRDLLSRRPRRRRMRRAEWNSSTASTGSTSQRRALRQ